MYLYGIPKCMNEFSELFNIIFCSTFSKKVDIYLIYIDLNKKNIY